MNSPREKPDFGRHMRAPLRLVLLCIAVGIVAAFPASALTAPPSNDDFANAENLGGESSASASGTNVDATAEPGEPDHAGIPAEASVWYRWTAPANGQVRIETCDSDFDTVLAVYTGSAVNALTPVASNDDTCGLRSRVDFNAAAGTIYRIAVDGYFGDQGSIELALGPGPHDPSQVLYVALGDSVAAGVGASLSYVDRLLPHYQSTLGVTLLSNRSRSGETSGSIRTSGQLASALADINAPSDTRVVTINIGGNDGSDCNDRWADCAFRSNLSATLSDLSAALDADPGPEALIVMAYYNPASGLGGEAPSSGEWWYERQLFGTDLVIDCEITTGPRVGINDVIFQEARRHGALLADAYTAMKPGGQAFMAGIHPNDAGHAAIADAFREASVPCRTEEPPDGSPPPSDGSPPPLDGSPPPDGTEPDTLAPTTVITKGPKGKTKRRKASFRFRATEPSTFQCRLTGKRVKPKLRAWRGCGSAQPARRGQRRYRKLRPGRKAFRVRATDRAGNVGKPAVRKWRVMRRRR
jgi:lysophospholipase L1-like esterase